MKITTKLSERINEQVHAGPVEKNISDQDYSAWWLSGKLRPEVRIPH